MASKPEVQLLYQNRPNTNKSDQRKNCLPSKAADTSLSSVQDLVTFARNIPDLMPGLPVSVVIDDKLLSERTTNQLTGILHHYGRNLEKGTIKKLQVLDANLCLSSSDFLVAALSLKFAKDARDLKDRA